MHNFPYNAKGINELVNYDDHSVDKQIFYDKRNTYLYRNSIQSNEMLIAFFIP